MCDMQQNNINNFLTPPAFPGKPILVPKVMKDAPDAIRVNHAFKNYGKNQPVLQDMTLTVKQGMIYGLLGASGCGKTTLLSCIIGQRKLNSGNILVFGDPPGTKGNGVPGKNLGYMPQDIALYKEYNVTEMFYFFGRLYGMKKSMIKKKSDFLINLLDLGFICNKAINKFSGGQKRRVSFGVALLHDAPLLILDEPTVGLDSMLRESIWKHMINLAEKEHRTVIITTHYIEEARQAHAVGLMRGGKLLADGAPDDLLLAYQCQTLENVFLKLCFNQMGSAHSELGLGPGLKRTFSTQNVVTTSIRKLKEVFIEPQKMENDIESTISTVKILASSETSRQISNTRSSLFHITSIMKKNIKRIWRSGLLLFISFLPVFIMVMFFQSMHHNPSDINIGVVNNEFPDEPICTPFNECVFVNMSCRYLDALKSQGVIMNPYYSVESALSAVKNGEVWAVVSFPHNFSDSTLERLNNGMNFIDNATLYNSMINIDMDYTNLYISNYLQIYFLQAFRMFTFGVADSCEYDQKAVDIPLSFAKPIYGEVNQPLGYFPASGMSLLIVMECAMLLTLYTFVEEAQEGVLQRLLSSGVRLWEIIAAQMSVQGCLMVYQMALSCITTYLIFSLPMLGNAFLMLSLYFAQGVVGLLIGMIISLLVQDERMALHILYIITFPLLLLTGCFFPLESMPLILYKFCLLLPNTYSTIALRSIIFRGWSLDSPDVYLGFISVFSWIGVLLIFACAIIRFKEFKM